MNINRILILLGLTLVTSLLVARSKHDSAPDSPPIIQFNAINRTPLTSGATKRDSVIITIHYKDQDGNLGEQDTSRIRQVFANQSWSNYRLETLQYSNGTFSALPGATTPKQFFPYLGNQNKPVEGTLSFAQSFPYSPGYKLVPLKFSVQIRDRNLNESNVVETDTIRLPVVP